MTDEDLNKLRVMDWRNVRKRVHEHISEMGREGDWLRINSVLDRMDQLREEMVNLFFCYKGTQENKIIVGIYLSRKKDAQRKLGQELSRLLSVSPTNDKLTQATIDRAKDYPIEELIDVKHGMARCISGSHEDKHPSMSVKNNYAKCFSCGWKGDAITVAREIYGLTFVEAVRRLT